MPSYAGKFAIGATTHRVWCQSFANVWGVPFPYIISRYSVRRKSTTIAEILGATYFQSTTISGSLLNSVVVKELMSVRIVDQGTNGASFFAM
jgi:hypothetical protein